MFSRFWHLKFYFSMSNGCQNAIFTLFLSFSNLCNPWFYAFFPQQFLYFLPLPQVLTPRILLVFIVFIVLSVFVGVTGQCTFSIYHIISIYCIYNISLRMSNRCHWHLTYILIDSLTFKQFIYLTFIYLP